MKTIINIIASAALVIAPVSAMASAGWAFDNPNVPEVTQGSASAQKGSSGAGWAFNNPNVEDACGCGESVTIAPAAASSDFRKIWFILAIYPVVYCCEINSAGFAVASFETDRRDRMFQICDRILVN